MSDSLPTQKGESQDTQGNTNAQGEQSGENSGHAESTIARPPADIPPSPPNSTNPNNERKEPHITKPNWVEVSMFIVEILGILGLAYYCWINHRELQVFDSERQTMELDFQITQSHALAEQTVSQSQLIAMQGQSRSMQDQSDMMRVQIQESQAARFFDERAWIFPSKESIENLEYGQGFKFFKVAYKNSGKTPAIHVITWMTIASGDSIDLKNDPNPGKPEITVPPDGTGSVDTSDAPIGPNIIQNITNGQPNCIFGTIRYDDVFGKHHWTQFCYSIGKDFSFTATKTHNGCDDQAD